MKTPVRRFEIRSQHSETGKPPALPWGSFGGQARKSPALSFVSFGEQAGNN